MAEVDRWSIDKLDSSNWPTWKFQMKHLLLARGLWGLVNGTEALQDEANAQQQADYNKRSQKAFSTIVMAIGSSQLYLVTSCEGPVAAWTALRNHFERETLVNKLMLKKQYFRMEMEEGTSVEEHIKRMKELTDRLAAINAPITEEDQIVTLLGSLPATYSTLVTALEARDTVTLGYAQQALIREEQRLKGLTGGSVATGGSTGRALLGKQSDEGRKHSQKKVCFLCGETGHFCRDCPRNQQSSRPKHKAKPVSTESVGSHSDCDTDDGAFGASSSSCEPGRWIVDSAASSHMTPVKEALVDYVEFDKPQMVCLGDGRTVEAFGRGNVHLSMVLSSCSPKRITMYDALYVPNLKCNLFSVRAAATKGNVVKFGEAKCWIHGKSGKLLGMGTVASKLYYLDCHTVAQDHVTVVSRPQSGNTADLWHQRLGHLNGGQLKEMLTHNMVMGMKIPKAEDLSFCEKCVEGKMAKIPFKSVGEIRSVRKLQCVHSDVCGPMPTVSIGGRRYFVTFIDDYTRCCRVYCMKNKSEVFDKFKEFELCTTNECGNLIGTLRSDNGGEYLSKEFEEYLRAKGIHHELSAPYSPAQNGVAERLNRTLMESARTMMAQAGLSEKYWAEAVATAAYLRNRRATRSLKKMTPYERWYGRKPNLAHLRVFGCVAYAYVPDSNRNGKLSKKAERLRFVGYSLQTKGYSRPSVIRPPFIRNLDYPELKMTVLLEYFEYRCAFY